MKKTILLIFLAQLIVWSNYGKGIEVLVSFDGDFPVKIVNGPISIPPEISDLKKIKLTCSLLPAGDHLEIIVPGEANQYYTTPAEQELTFSASILDKEISIIHLDNTNTEVVKDKLTFKFVPQQSAPFWDGDSGNGGKPDVQGSIGDYLNANYPALEPTPFGFLNKPDNDKRIHIFFDLYGNSLLSTIPQGISNAQYVVHIIYPFSLDEPDKISYSVKQKTGTFSSALLFNNAGFRAGKEFNFQGGEKYHGITERKFLLGTATDDLSFDITATTSDGTTITKNTLESYTIKMSPVYHGSFDVGLIKTNLSDPDFSLVQHPDGTKQVVKQTGESPKGIVTIMASFYVSPVIVLESIFGKKKIPFYKLTGRNFLDDHKLYERFYPTIGVGINDKIFENIFYGINWELARGLSIFGGWHTGKVHTFEKSGYEAGITPVTNEEFEFYKNTRWKTSTAIGVKLDIMIVRNLFGNLGAP